MTDVTLVRQTYVDSPKRLDDTILQSPLPHRTIPTPPGMFRENAWLVLTGQPSEKKCYEGIKTEKTVDINKFAPTNCFPQRRD